MCPDGHVLSAFIDGEIAAPWREKIGNHIAGCASCSEKLADYRLVQSALNETPVEGEEEAMDRVRARILFETRRRKSREPFFRRKIELPLPLAAAVLLCFVVMGGALAGISLSGGSPGQTVTTLPQNVTDQLALTIKVDNMEQLVQLLSSQDRFRDVTIELPETPQFSFVGEPQFLRAAEYSRSMEQ